MVIIFGMPGTGKTTYAKKRGNFIELDLGSDSLTDKQLKKLRSFTTQMIDVGLNLTFSSYPLYFDMKKLTSPNVRVIVAIPDESDKDFILSRVIDRGDDQFAALYAKSWKTWRDDWIRKFSPFRKSKNFRFVRYFKGKEGIFII